MDNGRKRELLEQLVDGLCAERGYEPLEAEKPTSFGPPSAHL